MAFGTLVGLRHAQEHRVLAVVVRVAVGVALLGHQDVGDVRGLALARNLRRRAVRGRRRTRAPAVAAGPVGRLHRRHHPIGDRAGRAQKRLDGVRHDLAGTQDVALDRIEDLGARAPGPGRPAPRSRLSGPSARRGAPADRRCRTAGSGTPDRRSSSSMIAFGIGALLQLAEHEHLVRCVPSTLAWQAATPLPGTTTACTPGRN